MYGTACGDVFEHAGVLPSVQRACVCVYIPPSVLRVYSLDPGLEMPPSDTDKLVLIPCWAAVRHQ